MPLISIIVPVYQVEAFLRTCVDSILAQSFSDFELILIDDGSPDLCGAICDEYAAADSRITVIHQKNLGVSAARNAGMDLAQGEYITFIDSDDAVHPSFLETLLHLLQAQEAQLAACSWCSFEEFAPPPTFTSASSDIYSMTGSEAAIELYAEVPRISVVPWCKLYQAALLRDLRFPVGMRHEDQAVMPIAVSRAETVAYTDQALYCYRLREQSFMHTRFSLKRYDDIVAIDRCILYFQAHNLPEVAEAASRRRSELLAIYSLQARKSGVYKDLPKEYKVRKHQALKWLRDNLSDDKFTFHLAKVYPKWLRPHAYLRKIKKILHIPCN